MKFLERYPMITIAAGVIGISLPPSFVSASKLCEPAAAVLFAAFLFAEIPTPLQIAGGAVTFGGVLLYSRVESRPQRNYE